MERVVVVFWWVCDQVQRGLSGVGNIDLGFRAADLSIWAWFSAVEAYGGFSFSSNVEREPAASLV